MAAPAGLTLKLRSNDQSQGLILRPVRRVDFAHRVQSLLVPTLFSGGGRLLPFSSAELYPVLLQVCQKGQYVGHDRVNSDANPAVVQTWQ
jgi:hypothetical protein